MATAYTDQVQKVYIAYYGRAADPVGLAYWAAKVETDGLDGIMASFGASAEATTLYGSLTNTAKVNALYQQSFGRDADFAGLMYYAGQLTAGTMTAATIAQNIFDGASGADATILVNKLVVAKAYTAAIDTASEVVAYSGTVAAASARALLTTVDADTVTASFDVATSVASIVTVANATPANVGTTFALTTVTDTLAKNTGGAGADEFVGAMTFTGDALASSATLTAGDTMSGGEGIDTLTLTVTGSAVTNAGEVATPTLMGVERVHVRSFESDASTITGAGATIQQDSVEVDLSNADASLTEIGTTSSSSVESDVVFANVTTLADVVMAGKGDLRVEYTTATVTGTTDSATLTLNDVGTSATAASAFNANGVETVSVVSSGAANFLTLEGGGYTTVNASGAKALTIEVADTDVTVFDASTATGAVTVDLSAITTTLLTSVIGGTGSTDTVTLGGADVSVTAATNGLSKFSGFETLGVDTAHSISISADTSGITSFDLTNATDQVLTLGTGYTGATTVSIKGDSTNADTVTNTANVALTVNANMADLDGTLTGGTGTDVLNVTMDAATQTVPATITLFETINVLSSATAGTNGGLTMDDANLPTTKAMTVDASGLASTEVFTFSASAETDGAYTVTGGAAADSLTGGGGADTITGGAGNDTIDGGAGGDTLAGGAGVDSITTGAGDDTVTGGAGNDTIISAGNLTAADTIDGGEGTDILQVTSVSSAALAGVTNVETLQLTSAASATLTANLSFDTIDLTSGATTETVTFSTGYTSAMTVKVDDGDTVTNTAADIALTITADSDALAAADNTLLTGADLAGVTNTLNVTNTTGTIDLASDISGFDVLNILDHATTVGNDVTVSLASYASDLVLNASGLDDGEVLTMTGAATGDLTVTGGAGADTLVLGTGTEGDTIDGGAGNDTITAGTNIGILDTIDGGAGTDTMTATAVVDGDMIGVTNVENLTVTTSATLGAYATTAGIARVDTVTTASVSMIGTTVGIAVHAAESTNTNSFTGGSGDDTFVFNGNGFLDAADTLNGTSGMDIIRLDNDDSDADTTGDPVTAVLDIASNIDKVVVNDTATDNAAGDVTLTMANGTYDQASLIVDASALDAGEVFTFNALDSTMGDTDEVFVVTGGAGADSLTGGSGNDTIDGGAGADLVIGGLGADTLTGGSGADTFAYLTTTAIQSGTAGASTKSTSLKTDTVTDFVAGSDSIRLTATMGNTAQTVDFTDKGDAASIADGLALLSGVSGEYFFNTGTSQLAVDLDGNGLIQATDLIVNMTDATGFASSDMDISLTGGTGLDTITTGGGDDNINAGSGADADVLVGGSGNDTYHNSDTTADLLVEAANGGTDTIYFGSGITFVGTEVGTTAAGTSANGALAQFEQIVLNGAITATFDDEQVSGQTIAWNTVGASVGTITVTGGTTVTIDASNWTFAAVTYTGTAGTVTGTAMTAADVINLNGGSGVDTITAASIGSRIDPGAGADVITFGAGLDIVMIDEEATVDAVSSFTTGASLDQIELDISALNSGAIVTSTGTTVGAATAAGFISYTAGTASAANATTANIIMVTDTTGIDAIADVETALGTDNIVLDAGSTGISTGDGLILAFYDANSTNMVVGYYEDADSATAGVFDGTNGTFVELLTLGMTTSEYAALDATNFDFI